MGKTAEEQGRLNAAACALVRCADGVPDSDPNWIKLSDMQRQGDTYTAEKEILKNTGEFVYQRLDSVRDGLTRNGETVTRVGGAVNLGAGAVGTIGGGIIATGGAASCLETLGLGCVAIPIGLGIAGASNQQMQQGNAALFGSYQSGEGQRVLDSFNLATYPGERDPLVLIGIDAAKFGLAYVGGKYIPQALAKGEGLGTGAVKGRGNLSRVEVDLAKVTKGTPEYNILNTPPPNSQVKLSNGTEFKTNPSGYVDEITYSPSLNQGVRDARQTAAGKEGLPTDVGGHIQACSLGGTCDRFNLFPQDGNFNNSAYKRWENEIKGALNNGDQVGSVTVRFSRTDPASARPDSLVIDYSVNGEKMRKSFRNEAGQ